MNDLIIDIVPYFNDNYCYLIHNRVAKETALFDCGDARPVVKRLGEKGWDLTWICVTHFHSDHAGGVADLLRAFPKAKVAKPADESRLDLPGMEMKDGDSIKFGNGNINAISVPAHTKYCTNYFVAGLLFVGDTLFSAGCGRLFEGNAADLEKALNKIAAFPDETRIYHGHEYTLTNLEFAKTVEPENQAIFKYSEEAKKTIERGGFTTPTTLRREKKVNPFLRIDHSAIISSIDPELKLSRTERLGLLRRMKDSF